MPNYEARKRLKKKMLDRWENEGGKIAVDSTKAESGRGGRKGDRKRQLASHRTRRLAPKRLLQRSESLLALKIEL